MPTMDMPSYKLFSYFLSQCKTTRDLRQVFVIIQAKKKYSSLRQTLNAMAQFRYVPQKETMQYVPELVSTSFTDSLLLSYVAGVKRVCLTKHMDQQLP